MEENQKGQGLAAFWILLASLILCIAALVILLLQKGQLPEEEKDSGEVEETGLLLEDGVYFYEVKDWKTGEKITVQKEQYCITDILWEGMYKANGADGKCGIINQQGEWIVPPEYEYMSHAEDAWVCLEKADGYGYVFDSEGKQLYRYASKGTEHTTKDGIRYNRTSYYRYGMRIDLDIGITEKQYYGAHYYNAATEELIFEREGYYEDVGVPSLPDETGTAAVIVREYGETAVYKITADGYGREAFLEPIAQRSYYDTAFISWRRSAMSDGWLRTDLMEYRGELLGYSTEWKEILYNIHTREIVPLPEKYQQYSKYYWKFHGLYYGITRLTAEEYYNGTSNELYYAVCCGSKILTEEIYAWIEFGERYIIAGNGNFAHILDYDGTILAEYADAAGTFEGGRMLVYDGRGVYCIDEELEQCSDYIITGTNIFYCQPRTVITGTSCYVFEWLSEQDNTENQINSGDGSK